MTLFVAVYLASAALLALWFDLRFPSVRPVTWGRIGIAAVATMAVDEFLVPLLHIGPRLLGVMGVALPAIAATMLVCLWMLRMLRSSMPA
jgi:hypothetical protein